MFFTYHILIKKNLRNRFVFNNSSGDLLIDSSHYRLSHRAQPKLWRLPLSGLYPKQISSCSHTSFPISFSNNKWMVNVDNITSFLSFGYDSLPPFITHCLSLIAYHSSISIISLVFRIRKITASFSRSRWIRTSTARFIFLRDYRFDIDEFQFFTRTGRRQVRTDAGRRTEIDTD